jgi:hypothetical protein
MGNTKFREGAAGEWFLVVEEAVDPGSVIAETLDAALAEAEQLELELARQAVAAAELAASCAGHPGEQLPDHILIWTQTHPHLPHDSETEQAVQAVTRIGEDSELRQRWQASGREGERAWRHEIDDLIARLGRSGAGEPATLAP